MWRTTIVGISMALAAGAHAATTVSPRAQALLSALPFTTAEREKILEGALVTTESRDPSSERELAITMAFLIADPPADLVPRFQRAADYGNDKTVIAYGELHGDGSLEDLAKLHLSPAAVAEARHFVDAKPGLDLNLSPTEIAVFDPLQEGDVGTIETEIRKMLLARYRAYRAKGLAGIAPYARADGESRPGDELAKATRASSVLAREAPEVVTALLEYPNGVPAGTQERFFWVSFLIDGRPTLTLTHRMTVRQTDGTYVLVDRHYYVSRSHNDVQMVAGVFPVDEGALVLFGNRTVTDQLGGFGASAKQAIGRKVMGGQLSALYDEARRRFVK